MTSIKTSVRKNLHAKCYLNEKEALLTSMNLYEYSQEHNDEMGILVSVDQRSALKPLQDADPTRSFTARFMKMYGELLE